MSAKTPTLATKSRPLGKPGGPGLFRDKRLDLPPYVQNIAHSLMRKRGMSKSRAIQMALGAVERWKNGGDDVSPEVRAAAAKAWAQWEAAKAKARATPNKSSRHANDATAVNLAWDAAAHPRAEAGTATGGQFVAVGQARDSKAAESQKDLGAQDLYRRMLEGKLGALKDLSDADLQKLSRILYSFKTSDERVVKARIAVANELDRRGMDVKDHGALGGGRRKPAAPKVLDSLLSGPDGGRELLLAADRAGVIDLAALQHWRHGWKPITPYAVAVKAKQLRGSTKGKSAELPKSLQKRAGRSKASDRSEAPSGRGKSTAAPVAKSRAQAKTRDDNARAAARPRDPNREQHRVGNTLFEFPALPPDDSGPVRSAQAKRKALLEKAAKVKSRKPSKQQPFRAPRSSKPHEISEGQPGGKISFEGGRTGTVWSDAPNGGKWVIPDDRKPGEAHAIYVDKRGDVHKDLSSRDYQRKWLEGARKDAMPATARREREQQAASTPDSAVQKARESALKGVATEDRKAYFAAYRRRLSDGVSPMEAHRKAMQDMVVERSNRSNKPTKSLDEVREETLHRLSDQQRKDYWEMFRHLTTARKMDRMEAHTQALRAAASGRAA